MKLNLFKSSGCFRFYFSLAFILLRALELSALAGSGPSFPQGLVGEKFVVFKNLTRENVRIVIDSCTATRPLTATPLWPFAPNAGRTVCHDNLNVNLSSVWKSHRVMSRSPSQGQQVITIGPQSEEHVWFKSVYGNWGDMKNFWSLISFSEGTQVCQSYRKDLPEKVGGWDNISSKFTPLDNKYKWISPSAWLVTSGFTRTNHKYGWISPSAWLVTAKEKNRAGVTEVFIEENSVKKCLYFSPKKSSKPRVSVACNPDNKSPAYSHVESENGDEPPRCENACDCDGARKCVLAKAFVRKPGRRTGWVYFEGKRCIGVAR